MEPVFDGQRIVCTSCRRLGCFEPVVQRAERAHSLECLWDKLTGEMGERSAEPDGDMLYNCQSQINKVVRHSKIAFVRQMTFSHHIQIQSTLDCISKCCRRILSVCARTHDRAKKGVNFATHNLSFLPWQIHIHIFALFSLLLLLFWCG